MFHASRFKLLSHCDIETLSSFDMPILSCRTLLGSELPEFLDASAVIDWAFTCSSVWTSSSCMKENSFVRLLQIRHFIACFPSAVVCSTVFQKFTMPQLVSLKISGDPSVIKSVVKYITLDTQVFRNLECMQLVSTSGSYPTWCDSWV